MDWAYAGGNHYLCLELNFVGTLTVFQLSDAFSISIRERGGGGGLKAM